MINLSPDLVLVGPSDRPTRAPAVLARYGTERRIELASRYSLCGGPALLDGLDVLLGSLAHLR